MRLRPGAPALLLARAPWVSTPPPTGSWKPLGPCLLPEPPQAHAGKRCSVLIKPEETQDFSSSHC